MNVCIVYNVGDDGWGHYRVNLYVDDKLIREYDALIVKVNDRFLPPAKDVCVNTDVAEYNQIIKLVEIYEVKR